MPWRKNCSNPPPGYIPTVWVSTELHRKGASPVVRLTIRDNGTGIPDSIAEKIFDPFFTTKKVGVGTGLGLSVSHGIIQRHAGQISVSSVINEGTCFKLVLPVHQANPS